MTNKTKELEDMELHEVEILEVKNLFRVKILRVYNGWLYTVFDKLHSISSTTFVPEYSNVNADARTGA